MSLRSSAPPAERSGGHHVDTGPGRIAPSPRPQREWDGRAGTHHGVVLRRLQQRQGQLRGKEREASGTGARGPPVFPHRLPRAAGIPRPAARRRPAQARTHHRAGTAEPPPRPALPLKPPPAPRGTNQSAARPPRSQSTRRTRPLP